MKGDGNMSAASHASNLFGTLPLLALLLAGFAFLVWNRRDKASTEKRIAKLDQDLDSIRNQITLVTTDGFSGGKTLKTFGYIESTSDIEATSAWEYRLAEKEAILKLANSALSIGANALIGIRKINANYAQAGSRWRVARVSYCGTAILSIKPGEQKFSESKPSE